LGHEEEVAYSPCDEVYGGLGVSTPKCAEELELGELPLGTDIISQEVCLNEDQSSATNFRECSFVESTLDVGIISNNLSLQQDRDVYSYEPHHFTKKLKVSEGKIEIAMRHFDDTHALVVEYCWRATMAQYGWGDEFTIVYF
jgi:hypothetical protein